MAAFHVYWEMTTSKRNQLLSIHRSGMHKKHSSQVISVLSHGRIIKESNRTDWFSGVESFLWIVHLLICCNVVVYEKRGAVNKWTCILFSTILKCQFHYFQSQFLFPRSTRRFHPTFTKHIESILDMCCNRKYGCWKLKIIIIFAGFMV